MECYSAIEKNEIMPFAATWMDLEIIMLSEVSQRKTSIICYHLYVESKKKKNDTNELIYKTETLTDLENKVMAARRKGWGGGIDWEFGTDNVHTAIFKIDNQQGPTV